MSNRSLYILFNSKIRVKILKSLFRNGDKNFSARELADLTQIPILTVKKEIKILKGMGLLKIKTD